MTWFEVETKVKINDIDSLRKKIKEIASFKKKELKSDDYFALRRKFRSIRYPRKAFRIRKKPDMFEVNFKKWLKKEWDDSVVVKQEFEFPVKNKEHLDNLLALFRDLGFVEWVKKKKLSESYTYKKDKRVVIELNKVEHLGYFMEIEYLAKKGEIGKAKKKIRKVLEKLEINPKDIDNTGYTKMLWRRKRR